MTRGGILTGGEVSCGNVIYRGERCVRYSPIFKSVQRLTALLMTLCDQAEKYMFAMGRSGIMRPANILDKLFVAIPLPKRANRRVLCRFCKHKTHFMQHGGTHKRGNGDSHQQGNNIRPRRERQVLLDDDHEAQDKAEDENHNIPPPGGLLVVFDHVSMVTVVVASGSGAFVRLDEITAPEQGTMSNQGTNLARMSVVFRIINCVGYVQQHLP
jgi:hypothetical protein